MKLLYLLLVITCMAPQLSTQRRNNGVITGARLLPLAGQPSSGRLQVQINGESWRDVCDKGWGDRDGEVVCLELGFEGLSRTMKGLRIVNRSSNSVDDFKCRGNEVALSDCSHKQSNGRCRDTKGAGVTCIHSSTTESPKDSQILTISGQSTEDRTTHQRATSVESGHNTLRVASTTKLTEPGKRLTTGRGMVSPEQTTVGPVTNLVTGRVQTLTEGTQRPILTQLIDHGHGTTAEAATNAGGLETQYRSHLGKYIGLALGCILFIVCACFIVFCLLKRHPRGKHNGSTAASQPSGGFEQNSAVYENAQGLKPLMMEERDNAQAGYMVPSQTKGSADDVYFTVEEAVNARYASGVDDETERDYVVPISPPTTNSGEHQASNPSGPTDETVGKTASPYYLELLSGEIEPQKGSTTSKKGSEKALYFTLEPAKDVDETNEGLSSSADYFTVEDKGDLAGNGQYTTGVVEEKATPSAVDKPSRMSDITVDNDKGSHYYAYADPTSGSTAAAKGVLGNLNVSNPLVYMYADTPRLRAPETGTDQPPNADYFVIEERDNSMGAPVYNASEPRPPTKETEIKNGRLATGITENEYAYADPSEL
ncbi:uncharacterized protein LOC110980370 [Acanthaster planci]|uniref:Uncharacterized protein LOC110980370 n=1 Tax=Acanthaster planci TaxID=133434 RepID=A0A8B7YJT8_ACAPL|nr:uncharacterized protein LOC110980370 [Acanthaster planci]